MVLKVIDNMVVFCVPLDISSHNTIIHLFNRTAQDLEIRFFFKTRSQTNNKNRTFLSSVTLLFWIFEKKTPLMMTLAISKKKLRVKLLEFLESMWKSILLSSSWQIWTEICCVLSLVAVVISWEWEVTVEVAVLKLDAAEVKGCHSPPLLWRIPSWTHSQCHFGSTVVGP